MTDQNLFAWRPEHESFASALKQVLAERFPLDRLRSAHDTGVPLDAAQWRTLVEMGVAGLLIPDEAGGSGGDRTDLYVAGRALGAQLVGGAVLSSAVLAASALLTVQHDLALQLLRELAAGERIAALVRLPTDGYRDGHISGSAEAVLGAAEADTLVVLSGPHVLLVEAGPGVEVSPLAVLDPSRPRAHVVLREASATSVGEPEDDVAAAAWRHAWTNGAIFVGSEACGAAERCIDMTATHVRTRRQFGRHLGEFQATRHRLAVMVARTDVATAAIAWAAWQPSDSGQAELGAVVGHASACDALDSVAWDTVQVHGGMGVTWEHDAHLYVRRAGSTRSALEDPDEAKTRLLHCLEEAAE